jgi:long-chain fatty acid transport protein
MLPHRLRRAAPPWLGLAAAVALFLTTSPARAQFGLAISGVGPINRSMGGASTAAPIDSAGALYWNPATITGLPSNEMEVGFEFFIPRSTLTSHVPANAFAAPTASTPGIPPVSLTGTTGGNNGTFILPAFGLVWTPSKESVVTYGLGIYEIGGFAVNYPASRTNPILNPQAPFGLGLGPLYAQYQIFQFAPSVAFKLTDELSVGFAGNIDTSYLAVNPALFANPIPVTTPINPTPAYPSAIQGRFRGGGGFQVGVYYNPGNAWSFGASFKSTQWFDTYTWNSLNAQGQPVSPKFNLDYPLVVSAGVAYKGIDRLLIALDGKFFDYRDTEGFRHTGFDNRGALRGLGWQNVFGLALGAQYLLTDTFTVRAGYNFALNPVGNAVTIYNVAAPTILQHSLAVGASYDVSQNLRLSLTYAHDFQNQVHGPIIVPFKGPIPGSSVRSASTGDAVLIGATVTF